MSQQSPRVSVGLPVYNGEKYVRQAIESILSQTYTDLELIICDNRSTDSTPQICKEYAERDARVRYHLNDENIGWWRNFNRVVELAQGEFFMWAADDDLRATTYIERCLEVLDRSTGTILCYTQTQLIDTLGANIPREKQRRGYYVDTAQKILRMRDAERWDKKLDSPDPVKRFKGIVLYSNFGHEQYGLIRREVLSKTSLMRGYYGSDKTFLAQLCLLGRFASIPEPLFFNRRHVAQSSNLPSAKDRALWSSQTQAKVKSVLELRLAVFLGCWQAAREAENLSRQQRLACYWIVMRYLMDGGRWLAMFEEITGRTKRRLKREIEANKVKSETPILLPAEQAKDEAADGQPAGDPNSEQAVGSTVEVETEVVRRD